MIGRLKLPLFLIVIGIAILWGSLSRFFQEPEQEELPKVFRSETFVLNGCGSSHLILTDFELSPAFTEPKYGAWFEVIPVQKGERVLTRQIYLRCDRRDIDKVQSQTRLECMVETDALSYYDKEDLALLPGKNPLVVKASKVPTSPWRILLGGLVLGLPFIILGFVLLRKLGDDIQQQGIGQSSFEGMEEDNTGTSNDHGGC